MTTQRLISYIAEHSNIYTNVVITDNDDKTPLQAIQWLAELDPWNFDKFDWKLDFDHETLLVYKP